MFPHERSLVESFAGKPFVILGVNSDKDLDQVRPKFLEEKITWRSFWCGEDGTRGPIPTAWNVRGWPTLVLLDHEGVIQKRWLGSPDRAEDIDDLVAVHVARAEKANSGTKAVAATHEDPLLAAVDAWLQLPREQRAKKVPRAAVPKAAVEAVVQRVFATLREEALVERKDELDRAPASKDGAISSFTVKAAGKEMKVLERTLGDAPAGARSLWISMHGGGGAPTRVNDQQWRNQIGLYTPAEGYYVAPRAPTDTWNLWHEGHIDALFDRLIEDYVIARGVDPDRVYLLGYSAGGDGVYQLAPRMADRFAAASMMAGHPNGVCVLGLRNLPFQIWVGANDDAYQRNTVAAQWGAKLDELAAADTAGYVHETHVVVGKGHWMDREDAAAVPWMARHRRATWPAKVVWQQTGRTHDRFYWLAVPPGTAQAGQTVWAEVVGQTIALKTEGVSQLRLRLCDALLDLDQPIEVTHNGTKVFAGKVERSVAAIYESLIERLDPKSVATAYVDIGR